MSQIVSSDGQLAERVGFEPTVQLPALRFSRPARSTTPAPLRTKARRAYSRVVPNRQQTALGRGQKITRPPETGIQGGSSGARWGQDRWQIDAPGALADAGVCTNRIAGYASRRGAAGRARRVRKGSVG